MNHPYDKLQQPNFNTMYSPFSEEFSNMRQKPLRCVVEFLHSHASDDGQAIQPAQTLLEAGCGNGHNLIYAKSLGYNTEGFDICPEFVKICNDRGLTVCDGSILTPITNNRYDKILCISVIHNLKTEDERLEALSNLYQALKPGGSLLVSVWSYEEKYESMVARFPKTFSRGDNTVMWKSKSPRYYFVYDRNMLLKFLDIFQLYNSDASVGFYWEEQNWRILIDKPITKN